VTETPGGGVHLESSEIAAYLDRALPKSERDRVESHLADCAQCRRESVEVLRVRNRMRRRSRWLVIPPVAAAAVVLFVLVRAGAIPGTTPPVLRDGGDGPMPRVVIVSPPDSGAGGSEHMSFVWRSVGPGVSYRITISDPKGDVVWSAAASDTTARVPASVQLRRSTYYWYVDALLPDGRSITSGVHPFSVTR
jgi:putative zinc finger protein